MPPANAVQQTESRAETEPETRIPPSPASTLQVPLRLANVLAGAAEARTSPRPVAVPSTPHRQNNSPFQARVPVITGEVNYRGTFPIEGTLSGQLNPNGGVLTVRQRRRSGPASSEPELDGEISFKDMLRINGHVAGKIFSQKGTLIIAAEARVDGDIDVTVAMVGGIVNGDVVGRERVELGPGAVINGNIATKALAIKPGAVFTGDCRMLRDQHGDK